MDSEDGKIFLKRENSMLQHLSGEELLKFTFK